MKFWFEGDTVINTLKYKKVYMQTGDSIADFNKASYFAAIREDTVAEKIYFYYKDYYGAEGEYLLYDFSVNVGDEVSFYSLWCWWYPEPKNQVVKSIDSIMIGDHYRKRINFIDDYWSPSESWIEGIGSTHGLFFPGYFDIADAMDNTILLCVDIDGELIYQSHWHQASNCFIKESGVNIDENKKELFKIYPTIVDNFLYIETAENIYNFDYEIISLRGQVINKGKFTSNIINVANLNKGFYFIVVLDSRDRKNILTQKFIKY